LVIYLHGFASSGHSGKASYFGQRFRARGIEFHAPDLNLPDFSTLTTTRMLEQTRALIDRSATPVTLIGSSLGAFVAVNAAVLWPDRIARLILLAPALDLRDLGGPKLEEWKRTGQLPVFHFAYGRFMNVHYDLYEDARRYDAFEAEVAMPVLIFQGRRDTAVKPATVEAWAGRRPNVELHLLDDDHQLGASLDYMWDVTSRFLDSPPGSTRDRS
jgi:pimeloyl-ACP methyl ester carboxylesterase